MNFCCYKDCAGKSLAFREDWKKRNGQEVYYVFRCPKTTKREDWIRHLPENLDQESTGFNKRRHVFCVLHFDENSLVKENTFTVKGETFSYSMITWRLAENAVPTIFKGTELESLRPPPHRKNSKLLQKLESPATTTATAATQTSRVSQTSNGVIQRQRKKVTEIDLTGDELMEAEAEPSKPDTPKNIKKDRNQTQTASQVEIVDDEDEITEITTPNINVTTGITIADSTNNVPNEKEREKPEPFKPSPVKRHHDGKPIPIAPKPSTFGISFNPMIFTLPLVSKHSTRPYRNPIPVRIAPKPEPVNQAPIDLDIPSSSCTNETTDKPKPREVKIAPKPEVSAEYTSALAVRYSPGTNPKQNSRIYSVSSSNSESEPDPSSQEDDIAAVDSDQHSIPTLPQESVPESTDLNLVRRAMTERITSVDVAPPPISEEMMATLATPSPDWSVNAYMPNGIDQIYSISETILGRTNIEIVRRSITVDLTKTVDSTITLTFTVFAHEIPKMNFCQSAAGPFGDDETENFQNIQSALNEFGTLRICEGLGETRKALKEIKPSLISKSPDHYFRSSSCSYVIFKSGPRTEKGKGQETRCESCADIYQCLLLRYSGVKLPTRLKHLLISGQKK